MERIGSDVWKVGGKVFAIFYLGKDARAGITFKVSDMAYRILSDEPGCRPAPYFASRGMKWIQRHSDAGISSADLRGYIEASYHLVAAGLLKRTRAALGLPSAEAVNVRPLRSTR